LKKKALTSNKVWIFLGLMLTLALMAKPIPVYAQFENQTIFVDTPFINGTAVGIGNTVTINVNISNAVSLWAWQAGLKFDPTVINCTGIVEGEFMKRQGTTIWMQGSINNTAGEVGYSGASGTSGGTPVSGSGQLMSATFMVKTNGFSGIHLLNVKTNTETDTTVTVTPSRVMDKYTIIADSGKYTVSMLYNGTGSTTKPSAGIPDMILNQTGKELIYNMTYKSYTVGLNMTVYCNVTIPKTLLYLANPVSDTWMVKIDGAPVSFTELSDTSNVYLYFTATYTPVTSTKTIEIIGTGVVPELNPLFALPLLMAALAAAILLVTRKLRRGTTQWQTPNPARKL